MRNMKCMIMSGNNWSYMNGSENFEEKVLKPYQDNIEQIRYKRGLYMEHHTHNTGSATVFNVKPERWGSPLDRVK